ncbi:MAG TPA: DUF2326 domain-containing protein [Terriglobia bacterium]|nr:DUF2326 domain-containing protein [Terriglobia bacterium]
MIHTIRCDQPSFKSVDFKPGFNVVLATRTKAATDKDSRNGAGKTTLVEIVHYCLGSKADRINRLMAPLLRGWTFTVELDLRGKPYRVSRNTADAKRVILEGDFREWPVKPKKDKDTGGFVLSTSQWTDLLGWLMFDLAPQAKTDSFEPTFRSLFSYFVRRGRDAFSIPFEHFRRQVDWDKQVNTAFLLGLSWEYPAKLQKLKEQEKLVSQLRSAIKAGTFPDLLGTVGELESQKVRLEELVTRRGEELRTFRVHPQYQEYQEQANQLQSAIRGLNQENVTDQAMFSFYQESLVGERPPEAEKLAKMYQEAGVGWPDGVRKRLEDVQAFHDKLIVNRRAFLQAEISRLMQAIAQRTEEVRKRSDKRADLLLVLNTHGALAEYSELQRLQNEEIARLSAVNQKIANLKRIDEIKSQTGIERGQLQILARSFYEERRADRERALSLFNEFSQALYGRSHAGELIIDVVEGGYRFNVEIERQDSQGIEQMKVFCYDMTLATLWAAKRLGPEFLIHDSTIFADVDERQKAHALELAASSAEAQGFQYICCLNSDSIPQKDFREGFSLKPYVRIELTDEGETGGLLGIRY